MKFTCTLYLSFLFLTVVTSAQRLEKFSDDTAEFLSQLHDYVTASQNETIVNNFEDFDRARSGGVFTPTEMERIRWVANAMLYQRMTVSPYFSNYLKSLSILKRDELGETRFKEFHDVMDSLLANIENRRFKPCQEFLEFSFDFLERGALRLSNLGISWLTDAPRYKLVFEGEQPGVVFEKVTLIASRGQDSILIKNAAGTYYPVEGLFKGRNGTVTWERFGLGEEVFAELSIFEVDTKKSIYEVKSVKMHYPLYFGARAVNGSFSDKLVSPNQTMEGSYPRFESSDEILELKNIGQGVKFTGGFRLHGTTVYGLGTPDTKAKIELFNEKKQLVYTGRAELFTIKREERIVAESVESTIYFDKDSIFHPSVNMRFEIPTKELQLSRGSRGSDRNPFYNSLQQVNIDAEKLDFLIKSDSIYIGRRVPGFAKSVTPTVIESLHYFDEGDYRRLQNIASTNPIALMKVAFNETNERVMDADYLARKLNPKFSAENISSLLYDLVSRGFINYDASSKRVELKDKIFHYADAVQKKTDFDVLRVTSETPATNAVFSLKDNSIDIAGVSNIELSYAQKVGFKPVGDFIKMRNNRNMDFDGKVFAGFTTLVGKDFHFDYGKFQLQLDSVRYFDLFIPTGEVTKEGRPAAYSIGSRLEHLSGVLLIDAPSNKSGREDISIFPSLESKKNAFVYYDYKQVMDGVYTRDSFYFRLNPFSFNSLDKFGKQDVKFKGKLFSADIFPPFDETLLIREDTSLGFITKTPVEGYKAYQGKGHYSGALELSNKGFLGQGTLSYLGAKMDAEDIVFKPKQLTASADRFDLEEDRKSKIQTPQVRGYDVSIDWRPYKDSMYIHSKTAPFELFKQGLHTMRGALILTPGGLKGRGLFDWDKASMTSQLLSFSANSVTADTTDLKIKAFDSDAIALSTINLNGHVDFDKQIGSFKANTEFLTTTLPYNQFETSFNEFDWDMKAETVNFKSVEGKLGSFRSIHPDQDSLWFQGKTALYNLRDNLLKIGGVPYIVTSDAYVYPESGKVEIQPGGVITELANARIVADTINKYHVINRAKVNILGKKEYRASGFYEYNIGDKKQEIEFAEIIGTRVGKGARSEKSSVTRASGEIKERQKFFIDHKTTFQGNISLSADKPNLQFDGFAQLQSETLPSKNWFSLKCEGDKNDLAIAFDTPLSPEGEQLFTGLYLSKETASAYPRVMMPLFFRKDRPVLHVKGILQYDEKTDKFIFGDSLKVLGGSTVLKGNKLVYDNKTGNMDMEGRFNLGSALKYVSVDAAGKLKTTFGEMVVDSILGTAAMSSKIEMNAMLGAKMIVPENLMKIIETDFKSSTFDASAIVYAKDMDFYRKAVAEMFPSNDEMRNAMDGIGLGSLVIPKKYNPHTFLFDRVPMTWDSDYQSFVSTTEKIGLASINGEMININITAYIEVKMPTNEDDRLYIYIKSPSQLYYFFGYRQGILNLVSNNTRFMDELLAMKEKDAIIKMPDGETYEIQPVNPGTANAFVNRIEAVKKN